MVGESIVATSARNVMTMALDLMVTSRVSSTPARLTSSGPHAAITSPPEVKGTVSQRNAMNTLTTASRRSTGRIGGLLRARSSAAMPNPNHAASAHTNAATRRNLGSTACTKERPWAKGSSNIRAGA